LRWRASRLFASYHHARGDLYQHIAAAHERYGHAIRFAPDELSFTNPEAWAQIHNSRPQLKKSRYHFGSDSNSRLPQSMITAPDVEHMRLRRLTGPAFLNAGIFEIEPVLQNYSDLLCHELALASQQGSQDIGEWLLWTLNDVIGQLALDEEFECLSKRRMHPWPGFLMKVLRISATLNQFERFGLSLKLLQPLMSKEAKHDAEMFFSLAVTAIKKRLAREKDENTDRINNNGKRLDMVGLMLRELKGQTLTEPEVTANSILIVGGGAETTSTCLTATVYHLCKTPRVMQKLRQEIRETFSTAEDITLRATANLPYLAATIDESLRIFPVASYITPRLTPKGGHVIDNQLVPAGVSWISSC
jgi:cytochrome P450